jgi:hypothetical protein
MKYFYVFAIFGVLIFTALAGLSQPSTCTETLDFNWKNAAGSGFVWPITNGETSVSRTYSKTGINGTETVRVILSNPNGKNIDFSNCGTDGNHFYTATTADPNGTQDCGAGADGQFSYGPDYLTLGMTSDNSNDKVSLTFIFSYPVRISSFDIWDIDYQGGSGAGSWEDELDISAFYVNTPVAVSATSVGSAVIVNGNNTTALSIRSLYGTGSGNLAHTDAEGSIVLSTSVLVTSFTITYSNGPNDDGASDDHAIKLGSFQMCPNFNIAPLAISSHSLKGLKKGNNAFLNWANTTGIPVHKYELEFSQNNNSFSTIHTIHPSDISTSASSYSYEDKNVFSSSKQGAYYRLKATGKDGSIAYSSSVMIKGDNSSAQLSLYPNPLASGNNLMIAHKNIRAVTVYSVNGSVLYSKEYNGADVITIASSEIKAKGMMMVSVNGESYSKLMVY